MREKSIKAKIKQNRARINTLLKSKNTSLQNYAKSMREIKILTKKNNKLKTQIEGDTK